MRKKMLPKILAFLALFGIVISVVWTWILFIVSSNNNNPEKNTWSNPMTKEELEAFVKKYDTASGAINLGSWIIDMGTWLLDIKDEEK